MLARRFDRGVSDAHGEVLHRDLARGVVAGVAAAMAALALAACTTLAAPGKATLAHALGWSLGAAIAWTVGAVGARRAHPVLGVALLALLAPLAGLGGAFGAALVDTGRPDEATKAVIEGPRVPPMADHVSRVIAAALVLGPLLVARARRSGAAWELAAPLAGALVAATALGLAHLHGGALEEPLGGRAYVRELQVVLLRPFVLEVLLVVVGFALGLRLVDVVLARRDRRAGVIVADRADPRREARGVVALAVVGLAGVALLAEPGECAADSAERLLPWPRDPARLRDLGRRAEERSGLDVDPDLGLDWRPRRFSSDVWGVRELSGWTALGPTGSWRDRVTPFVLRSTVTSTPVDRRQDLAPEPPPVALARLRRAYELMRRSAAAGHAPALRGAGLLALHLDARLVASRPEATFPARRPASALRLEGQGWLRLAAAGGDVDAAMSLVDALDEDDPDAEAVSDEALRVLVAACPAEDDRPLSALHDRFWRASPGQRESVLRGLVGLAWRPRPARWSGRVHPRLAARPAPERALLFQIEYAPDIELITWETLAWCRQDAGALALARRRRLGPERLGPPPEPWQLAGVPARSAILPLRPDVRPLWPEWPVSPAERVALDAARAQLRERPGAAWMILDEALGAAPRSSALLAARALTFVELWARRPPLRSAHLGYAADLLARAFDGGDASPRLLAAQATFDAWEALATAELFAQAALGRLDQAARLAPGDVPLALHAARTRAHGRSTYPALVPFRGQHARRELGQWLLRRAGAAYDAGDLEVAQRLLDAAAPWLELRRGLEALTDLRDRLRACGLDDLPWRPAAFRLRSPPDAPGRER